VRKPLHSREGANIALHLADGRRFESDGPYQGPCILQQAHPLPAFDGRYPMVGSWIVGDAACGIGIREDDGPITRDSARFVPHAIVEAGRPGVLYA
jgi:glutathionylspermidine synthase